MNHNGITWVSLKLVFYIVLQHLLLLMLIVVLIIVPCDCSVNGLLHLFPIYAVIIPSIFLKPWLKNSIGCVTGFDMMLILQSLTKNSVFFSMWVLSPRSFLNLILSSFEFLKIIVYNFSLKVLIINYWKKVLALLRIRIVFYHFGFI